MRYAGFWIRFVAMFIDGIVSALGLLLVIIDPTLILASIAYLIIDLGNRIILQGIKGQTVGKMIIGIKVIKTSGEDITIGTAILRYVGQIISGVILMIGYIMAAFTQNKQALHDKIASTYVIYNKK